MRMKARQYAQEDPSAGRTRMPSARVLHTVPRTAGHALDVNPKLGAALSVADRRTPFHAEEAQERRDESWLPSEQLSLTADIGVAYEDAGEFLPLGGGGGYLTADGAVPADRRPEDNEDSARARRHLFSECEVVYSRLSEAILGACASLQSCIGESSATSIGLAMNGLKIDGIAPGSAAEASNRLATGDRIVSIDGVKATRQNFVRLATGPDVPGTNCVMEVCKAGSGDIISVTIGRQPKHDERGFLLDLLRTTRDRISPQDKECAKMMDLVSQKLSASWTKQDEKQQRGREIANGLEECTHVRLREGRALLAALHRNFLSLEDECVHALKMSSDQASGRISMLRSAEQLRAVQQVCEAQVAEAGALHGRYRSRLLFRFSRRSVRGRMRHHFEGLRQNSEQTGLVKRLLCQALRRARSHGIKLLISRIIYDWKDFVRHQDALHHKLFRCVTRLFNRTAGKALQVWSLWALEERRHTRFGVKIWKRTARTRLRCGFYSWNDVVVKQNQARTVLSTMLMRTIQAVCVRAWCGWSEAVTVRRLLRVVALRISKRRRRALLSTAVLCCQRYLRAQNEHKTKLGKGLDLRRRCLLWKMFGNWWRHHKTQAEYKKTMMRVLGRWQKRGTATLADTWSSWLAACLHRKSTRHAMSKAISRMMIGCCTRAWGTWALATRNRYDRRMTTGKLVLRVGLRRAKASLARWRNVVYVVRRRRLKIGRMLMRTIQAVCVRAWCGWSEAVTARRLLRVVALRISKRRRRALLSTAVLCCQRYLRAQNEHKTKLGKGLDLRRRCLLWKMFGNWWRHKCGRGRCMVKVSSLSWRRWRGRLSEMLASWRIEMIARKSKIRGVERLVRRRQISCQSIAWSRLHTITLLASSWRRTCARAQIRVASQQRELAKQVVAAWWEIMRLSKVGLAVRMRATRDIKLRVLEAFRNRAYHKMKRGLAQKWWQKQQREDVGRLVRCWRSRAWSSGHFLRTCHRIGGRLTRNLMAKWFDAVSGKYQYVQSFAGRQRLSLLISRRRNRGMCAWAIWTWHDCWRQGVQDMRSAMRALSFRRRHLLLSFLAHWQLAACTSIRHLVMVARQRNKWQASRARGTLKKWVACKDARVEVAAAAKVMQWAGRRTCLDVLTMLCDRGLELMVVALHRWASVLQDRALQHHQIMADTASHARVQAKGEPRILGMRGNAHFSLVYLEMKKLHDGNVRLQQRLLDSDKLSKERSLSLIGLEQEKHALEEINHELSGGLSKVKATMHDLSAGLQHVIMDMQAAAQVVERLAHEQETMVAQQEPMQSMSLVLDLNFDKDAGLEGSDQRKQLTEAVQKELAMASGLPARCFRIAEMLPGSVRIALDVLPGPVGAPSAVEAAQRIEQLANDTTSPLRTGLLSKAKSARREELEDEGARLARVVEDLQAAQDDKNEVITTLNAQMYRQAMEHKAKEQALMARMGALEKRAQEAKATLLLAQGEVETLEEEVRTCCQTASEALACVETMRQEHEAALDDAGKVHAAELKRRDAEWQGLIESAKVDFDELTGKCAAQDQELAALHSENAALQLQLQQVNEEVKEQGAKADAQCKAEQEIRDSYEAVVRNEKRLLHEGEQAQRSIQIWRELVAETETLLAAEKYQVECEQRSKVEAQEEHDRQLAGAQDRYAEVCLQLERERDACVKLRDQLEVSVSMMQDQKMMHDGELIRVASAQQKLLEQHRQEQKATETRHSQALAACRDEHQKLEQEREGALRAVSRLEAEVQGLSCSNAEHLHRFKSIRSIIIALMRASRQNVFPATRTPQYKFKTRTTLGLTVMPRSLDIDQILVGGPAYNSKLLAPGDLIVAVDGVFVSSLAMEEVTARLIGDDVAGTFVTLTVSRRGVRKDVKLKRISSESLADKRRIFELINETKNKAVQIRSPEIHLLMEKILEEWSAQVQSAYQHDEELSENFVRRDLAIQHLLSQMASLVAGSDNGVKAGPGSATLEPGGVAIKAEADDLESFWQSYTDSYYACSHASPQQEILHSTPSFQFEGLGAEICPRDLDRWVPGVEEPHGRQRPVSAEESERATTSGSGRPCSTTITALQADEALFGSEAFGRPASLTWSLHSDTDPAPRMRRLPPPPSGAHTSTHL